LVIDEAEFFGRAALNGLKLLMNKTRLTVCLCATPEAFSRWQRWYPHEADQVVRRFFERFELSVINPKDQAKDLRKVLPAGPATTDQSLQLIAAAASQFGHWSFVVRLADRLRRTPAVDFDDVKKATSRVKNQLRRSIKKEQA